MTDEPLKLTDEVLAVMLEVIYESPHAPAWTADQFIDAVRTLRDRARAVVEDASLAGVGRDDHYEVNVAPLRALREVLPEVKP